MSIHVMVFGTLHCLEYIPVFEKAFVQVSKNMKGTPGHIRSELLRDPEEPLSFILLGVWKSKEEFVNWYESPAHSQATAPMNSYWKFDGRKLFDVAVCLDT